MAQEQEEEIVGIKSNKTGLVQEMTTKEAEQHMKLHGRKFRNMGPVEKFTPEEAQEAEASTKAPKAARKGATPATADAPGENTPAI